MTTWTLYGVDGTELALTDCSVGIVHLGTSTAGAYGLPPVEFAERPSALLSAGSARGDARFQDRLIVLELVFNGATAAAVDAAIASTAALLNPQRGDCRLVIGGESGREYDIVVTYSGGFAPVRDFRTPKRASARVTFRAHQPYYRQTTAAEVAINFPVTGTGAVTTIWDAPIAWDAPVGWDGIDVGLDGTVRVSLPVLSTAPSWPRWEIAGPAGLVSIHNATNGRTLEWDGAVSTGQTLVIETEEGRRSARVDGVNVWDDLADSSEFWALEPGSPTSPTTNEILVAVQGADGSTSARMLVRPQWLSPE